MEIFKETAAGARRIAVLGAEGNVTGGSAVDVEALGFVPAARIAVGGGQEQ
jgi:hypothetical protein